MICSWLLPPFIMTYVFYKIPRHSQPCTQSENRYFLIRLITKTFKKYLYHIPYKGKCLDYTASTQICRSVQIYAHYKIPVST